MEGGWRKGGGRVEEGWREGGGRVRVLFAHQNIYIWKVGQVKSWLTEVWNSDFPLCVIPQTSSGCITEGKRTRVPG